MDEKFLTTEQVAGILQVHPYTILKFVKEGKLKGVKLGRVYRILESDVRRFIEERLTGKKRSTQSSQPSTTRSEQTHSLPPNKNEDGHYYIV